MVTHTSFNFMSAIPVSSWIFLERKVGTNRFYPGLLPEMQNLISNLVDLRSWDD
jgi:hypothetical protein